MKTIICLSLLALAIPAVATDVTLPSSEQPVTVTPEFVNRLAEAMRTNHPALRQAEDLVRAATNNAAGVRIWEDPMLRAGALAAEEEMRRNEGDLIYGLEQKLPLLGKESRRRKLAEAETATERAGAVLRFQLLRRDLAKTLFRTALADAVVFLGEEDRRWLETAMQTAESRYRSAVGTLTELSLLQNEFARRTNQLHADGLARDVERSQLNRFLNRPPVAGWPVLKLPPPAGPIRSSARVVELSLRFSPELEVMRRQTNAARTAVQATRRERLPDLSLDFEARNYSGNGDFRQGMFLLKTTFPWVNPGKYRRDIEREEARLSAAGHELADGEAGLQTEVFRLLAEVETMRREACLYRDEIIPRSETALASAQTAWTTGRGLFLEVIEARRMLVEARLMQARAIAGQYLALSEITLCCGVGDLESLAMVGAEPDPKSAPKQNP